MSVIHEGLLFGWFETGLEGVVWALQANHQNQRWDYEDLYVIETGDHLDIFNPKGENIWSDEVKLVPAEQFGGLWIHELPTNMDHREWFDIFMGRNHTGRLSKVEKVSNENEH